MKVLQAAKPRAAANPFIRLLVEAIGRHPSVQRADCGVEQFWEGPDGEDVLHLHWPHVLFDWDEPTRDQLRRAGKKLEEWAACSTVVSTFHDPHPHRGDSPAYRALYRRVFEWSEGIIHMGEASKQCFTRKFGGEKDQKHEVIPHGTYDCFPDTVSEKKAREHFELGLDAYVILAFSGVRHPEDTNLLLEGFSATRSLRKKLLVANSLSRSSKKTIDFYKQWIRITLDPRIVAKEQFVPDENVQYYLNAADVLVIPKKKVLNSGNVALGFTFGTVVVGPDEGVVGEVLRKTGNPTFNPDSTSSLAGALTRAEALSEHGRGEKNQEYAEKKMKWGDIAEKHIQFYQSV
ncbi:glycosyltransferase involved in cell wall biosynthesis [Salinibacter ruber]|uniref:Glycosyltransferase involved in cell wall biosynthesis n=1 Tax=Salinibacter ruber TaxID=146919 RepID=A0A9X2PXN2_9BACT|nr:hypothetical protein [Salinibacter ruber]MCS3678770.1 glycosyltransferase involved in cell wall biosynthesis [Salinibacter ruber]MCS3682387.1 glycosyltransferase involved in cell wall biosynthesis [Salinibacter ruber]